MNPDPVIQEVRQAKQAVAARHDHDLRKLVDALMESQAKSGREVVTLPPRKPQAA
jgi:hypothetical protein